MRKIDVLPTDRSQAKCSPLGLSPAAPDVPMRIGTGRRASGSGMSRAVRETTSVGAKGLKMNELSSRMMVTRGNITGITNHLVTAGLVKRVDVLGDKRACRVKLTPKGRKQFIVLAREHEKWIVQAFAGLGEKDITSLHGLLGRVKAGILKNMPPLK